MQGCVDSLEPPLSLHAKQITGHNRFIVHTTTLLGDSMTAWVGDTHRHNYKHMITRCSKEEHRGFVRWIRYDEFYCSVCTDILTKLRSEEAVWQPDWWFKTE